MNQDDIVLYWRGKRQPDEKTYNHRIRQVVFPQVSENSLQNSLVDVDNQLCLGTDHQVMAWLLDNGYEQSFDCIYIDPPYLTDSDYYAQIKIDTPGGAQQVKQRVFRDNGYRNLSSYLQHIYESVAMIKQLLSEQGSLFVHLDYHSSHYVKIILDEVFSPQRFVNEIVWCYGGGSGTRRHFHRKHDVIFWYSRGADYIFNPQYRPYSPGTIQRGLTKVKGDRYKLDSRGALLQDWWIDIPKILSPTAGNNWKFPTQKPVELVQRIIQASTMENSLVGDFYCGSGTSAEACENLGRRWIMSDNSMYAIQTSIHRLIKNNSRPFMISTTQPDTSPPGQLSIITECNSHLFGHEFTITLQSYQPRDGRPPGLAWIDFWEIGWLKGQHFMSLLQVIPAKRGQMVPLQLTLKLDDINKPLVVQVWDIQGGPVKLPLTLP
ncbi:MAG TPA: site-specific DNA-methyltransferase [Syntrophomonadaceae bacterium]|nr:site-specific DNA-methyltransferase [Syntrophomonadaceae bacterium]HQE23488.1 site-specific DNA-methyltransferase [Syntrophomonadaceae bacterium]